MGDSQYILDVVRVDEALDLVVRLGGEDSVEDAYLCAEGELGVVAVESDVGSFHASLTGFGVAGKVIVGLSGGQLVLLAGESLVDPLTELTAVDSVLAGGRVVGDADVAGWNVVSHSPVYVTAPSVAALVGLFCEVLSVLAPDAVVVLAPLYDVADGNPHEDEHDGGQEPVDTGDGGVLLKH